MRDAIACNAMERTPFREAWCSLTEIRRSTGADRHELLGPVGTFKSGRPRYEVKLYKGSAPMGTYDAMKLPSKFTDGSYVMCSKTPRAWDIPRKATTDDVYASCVEGRPDAANAGE